tara:strand:- start:5806 stop:6312 length:507 start_codon:yes stop_codon:yes gene_type:complete
MATSLQFIKSASASGGVSTLDISNCFSAQYDVYELLITKVDTASNFYPSFRLLKESDGSADTTSNYDSAGLLFGLSGTSEIRYVNQTSMINSFGLASTNDANNFGRLTIYQPFSGSSYTFLQGQAAHFYSALEGGKTIGVHKVEQSNSGIQLMFSNMTLVQASIYGVE